MALTIIERVAASDELVCTLSYVCVVREVSGSGCSKSHRIVVVV
jgi:hypothetical protein